nr:hypothetical protein [Tanacetum cinerariifolium]
MLLSSTGGKQPLPPAATAGRPPPSPPENFSGGLFLANPKRLPVTGSIRSTKPRATTATITPTTAVAAPTLPQPPSPLPTAATTLPPSPRCHHHLQHHHRRSSLRCLHHNPPPLSPLHTETTPRSTATAVQQIKRVFVSGLLTNRGVCLAVIAPRGAFESGFIIKGCLSVGLAAPQGWLGLRVETRKGPPPPPAAAGKLFRRAFFGEPKYAPHLPIYLISYPTRRHSPNPPQPTAAATPTVGQPPPWQQPLPTPLTPSPHHCDHHPDHPTADTTNTNPTDATTTSSPPLPSSQPRTPSPPRQPPT